MLKTTTADAVAALQEALIALPTELEARSEFFVQWRTRTIESLEWMFPDDPTPARQFKDIEFSPRRLTKDETRDAQLKLDAFLAGCATARNFLEETIRRQVSGPAKAPEPEVQGEAQTPELLLDLAAQSQPRQALGNGDAPETASPFEKQPKPAAPLAAEPKTAAPPPVGSDVLAGGTMDTLELCAPVRSSLARVLGAWDKGDQDMALVLSAQLLAELTVLARHDRFKSAFEHVVGKAFDPRSQPGVIDAVTSAAPLCLWSLVAAMNEVMKN